jgi:hypothetical protein
MLLMLRKLFISISLLLAPVPMIAPAHAAEASESNRERCQQSQGSRRRRSIMGGVLGGIAGRIGGPSIAGVSLPTSVLSDALLEILDCREQQQAATATDEAIRGGVGTTTSWTSESRPNVTGTSTVTAQESQANGGNCMTVTDVVIIDGAETRVPKRMCRIPPARRYTRAAA